MGLEIKRNNIILEENTGKIYGIVKYPQDLEYGWLSRITNIPRTICSINFRFRFFPMEWPYNYRIQF